MSHTLPESLSNVSCSRELTAAKNWLADGSISLNGITIEHTIQPSDEVQLPALTEHCLVVAIRSNTRQVSRFSGQEFDSSTDKGYSFLLPSGTPSEFAWEEDDEAIMFGITPQALSKVAEQTECLVPEKIEIKPSVLLYDDQIIRYAHCLLHEIRTGGIGGKLYAESILTCFNIHLLRHYCTFEAKVKEHTSGLAPYKLKEILAYIDAHLTEGDLSLNTMADRTELSTYYFARQFKQSTGYAPHKYVIHQRLKKAKRLLKQRRLSISQVAFECGFSNQSHFGRAFRKEVGTTPKRYRESL